MLYEEMRCDELRDEPNEGQKGLEEEELAKQCSVCQRPLRNMKSRKIGTGPVCAKKEAMERILGEEVNG